MTKYWGPIGWATLHTVAVLYPDQPTTAEQSLARQWIQSFCECISCPTCQGHFKTMLDRYPGDPFINRKEFILFVLRAHNTVNRRLNRKIYTIDESWTHLRTWIPDTTTARSKRAEYIRYLRIDWGRQTNLAGISALIRVRDLSMTEQQYWTLRDLNWDAARAVLPAGADVQTPIVVDAKSGPSILPTVRIQPRRFQPPVASTGLFSLISR